MNDQGISRPKRTCNIDIDYKELHNTGWRVEKPVISSPESENLSGGSSLSSCVNTEDLEVSKSLCTLAQLSISNKMDVVNNEQGQLEDLEDDIYDFIDEHMTESYTLTVEDIDGRVIKLESFRTQYRNIVRKLKSAISSEDYEADYEEKVQKALHKIKEHIKYANQWKENIRKSEEEEKLHRRDSKLESDKALVEQTVATANFLIEEVHRRCGELDEEFNKDRVNVSDEELLRRKEGLSEYSSQVDRLSTKVQKALEIIPFANQNREKIISKLKREYQTVVDKRKEYENYVQKELAERELMKEKFFKTSSLNIKLEKFKGFSSELDIYSFQMEFEKLYKRSTPKDFLPDLLKNNYLVDAALALVKSVDAIDEIWKRLKMAYGDPKVMIQRKLAEVKNIGSLNRMKKPENLREALMTIINTMNDLIKLAKRHNVENVLYYGGSINTIYSTLGDERLTRWLRRVNEDTSKTEQVEEEQCWPKLIIFLEEELKIQQEMSKIHRGYEDNLTLKSNTLLANGHSNSNEDSCHFCGKTGHVKTDGPNGVKLIQYFSCRKFVELKPNQRFLELREKGLCIQCLYPGAKQNQGKHSDGNCQNDFTCKHTSHNNFLSKKHVLVCQEHCLTVENKELLENYRSRCITRLGHQVEEFARNIKLSFHSCSPNGDKTQKEMLNDNAAVFILQTIRIGDECYTIFFDSGCSDFVTRYSATQRIGNRSNQEVVGPVLLGGVGSIQTQSTHGIYKVRIPLYDESDAVFGGVCLDKITATFPMYPLRGQVQDDIEQAFRVSGGNTDDLPGLPEAVGGDVDFLIGIRYLRYHPEPIFTLPSGLTIYQSPFLNADGTRGVVGGPHAVFTEISKALYNERGAQHSHFSEQLQLYSRGYLLSPDEYYLDEKFPKDIKRDGYDQIITQYDMSAQNNTSSSRSSKWQSMVTNRNQKLFQEVEDAGSEIFYRCMDCRGCKNCLKGDKIELISVREEIEQDVINKSVKVDLQRGEVVATLPVIDDAAKKLAPNKKQALAVFKSQIKRLTPEEKNEVIASEKTMQDLGYVDYVRNLTPAQQQSLKHNVIQNFLPWRVVWNLNSCSTCTRLVFDASQRTDSGYCLNDMLAKGRNSMNKLVEIMIRWVVHIVAFHTDVRKMYNSVKLQEEDWCYQRYVWEKLLDINNIPEEKVIMTGIYGVKSTGNQAERGLRETGRLMKEQYPNANEVIQGDIYVDDCMSGSSSTKLAYQLGDELDVVLRKGGFMLKGFTFSGKKPIPELTKGGVSVSVAGCKWFPEEDKISLDISDLNFSKKFRGKKNVTVNNEIPDVLTRRDCVGKVAEVFDLTGRVTPIVASMKLSLVDLVERKLSWDDALPDELKEIWMSHFEMIKELKSVRFNRAVIPEDAISLDVNTIELGDASQRLACSAIYVRFARKGGSYSCQLIFSRSKVIKNLSQPRAELFAALLNTHTAEVVRRSLRKYFTQGIKLTDSQIVLHWLNNKDLPLKQWVRNRINEILRFTAAEDWWYTDSSNMLADLGTRKGAKVSDIGPDSEWCCGYEWMKREVVEFPVKSIDEIKLKESEIETCNTELLSERYRSTAATTNALARTLHTSDGGEHISEQVKPYYEHSRYLIDPNKFRFSKAVRIMGFVKRFVNNVIYKHKMEKGLELNQLLWIGCAVLTEDEIKNASKYFYRIATQELKKFVDEKEYKLISTEEDQVVYYTGRILPTQKVTSNTQLSDVMKDLCATTFVVPIVSKHSPLAYSIINEVHWYHPLGRHSGVETVWRITMEYAFILGGRELVKLFRRRCERCRYIQKKTIDVSMAPISDQNLKIAPAFYYTQVDIAGPFTAYSLFNKRKSIKIWWVVFCCSTTSTINIKVMEDYGTPAFIKSFIRFSCEVGYPKKLLPDEGSQLVKGCEAMKLSFKDIQDQLYQDHNVAFKTCPVGGHNMHGRVERKIRHIKDSLKTMTDVKCSVIDWETLGCQIANCINDLPIALKNTSAELETIDLITPNRLRLGRNNQRSPVGPINVSGNLDKFLSSNEEIFNSWFTNWLICHVPRLIQQTKWFQNDRDLCVGDVILFLKHEGKVSGNYQYGMVKEVVRGADNRIRRAVVKYRNSTENIDRETNRAVRQLVMIHPVEELSILQELGEIAIHVDANKRMSVGRNGCVS